MKKTRWIALILALALVLSLTACAQDQKQTSGSAPKLSITSTIFGSGDTGGKTTLKNILLTAEGPGDQTIRYSDPNTGERLDYPVYHEDGSLFQVEQPPVSYTGSAVLTLEGEDLDDSKIDSSNAVVSLLPGDGYYTDELILNADKLEGTWQNGTLEYTLKEGDLEWNVGDYQYLDDNSGREWSILGGDGNGCYTFRFEVSGITYDGKPVDAASFQVKVYIWGRTGTDLAPVITDLAAENHLPSGASQGKETQWTWAGEQGDFLGGEAKPILCDDKQDDFFITWPTGTDASSVTADNVTVTLNTQYGESYQLKSAGEHVRYAVFTSESETQVAVTFRHAAFTPVFNTMTIEVNADGLSASNTYDIAHFYPAEMSLGRQALEIIRQRKGIVLPESEAASIALHLINGEMENNDMHATLTTTKVIRDITNIIEQTLKITLDTSGFNYSRFAMHIRYLLQRMQQGTQEVNGMSSAMRQLIREYPDIYYCTTKVVAYFSKQFQWECNEDEKLYLFMHIIREKFHGRGRYVCLNR